MAVTPEQQAEVAWTASILALAGDGILCTDGTGRIFLFNRAAERMFGYRADDVLGRRVEVLMPARFRRAHREHVRAFAAGTGQPQRLVGAQRQVLGRRRDGTEFPLEIMLSRQHIGGQLVVIAGVRDVSERRRGEEELRLGEQRFRRALVHSPVVLFDQDLELRYTWVHNPSLGFKVEDVLGRSDADLLAPDEAAPVMAVKRRVIATGRPEHQELRTSRAGVEGWYDLYVEPLQESDGRITGVACCAVDRTEHRRARDEAQLLMAELEHRLKNMVGTVQGLVLLTLRSSPTPERFAEAIRGRLKAFAAVQTLLTRGGGLGATVGDLVQNELAAYRTARPDITIRGPAVQLEPRLALSLGLVLHELTTNAAKYGALSAPQGRVEITWATDEAEAGSRLVLQWIESGGAAVREPGRRGFGSELIERTISHHGGVADLVFHGHGVRCRIEMPLPSAAPAPLDRQVTGRVQGRWERADDRARAGAGVPGR